MIIVHARQSLRGTQVFSSTPRAINFKPPPPLRFGAVREPWPVRIFGHGQFSCLAITIVDMKGSSVKMRRYLACPFAKRNPKKFRYCYTHRLHRIGDVKQHLRREHAMPIYCPICYEELQSEQEQDQHVRTRDFTEQQEVRWGAVTREQQKLLTARVSFNLSTENSGSLYGTSCFQSLTDLNQPISTLNYRKSLLHIKTTYGEKRPLLFEDCCAKPTASITRR
jgi:hypothetical protein